MQPIYLSIQQEETGAQIRKLMMKNGYTVRDVQGAMGFENPQAIYKWISGKSLPSLNNPHNHKNPVFMRVANKFV